MGRAPCCEKVGLKRGRWTAEEDEILRNYIEANGEGSWRSLPKNAGLLRCGKSCRLRWINYLRSDLKRGNITAAEEEIIINLHASLGNRWSVISGYLPGRTDNEIKNYWNSHLSRRIHSFIRRPDPNFTLPPDPAPRLAKNRNAKKMKLDKTPAAPESDVIIPASDGPRGVELGSIMEELSGIWPEMDGGEIGGTSSETAVENPWKWDDVSWDGMTGGGCWEEEVNTLPWSWGIGGDDQNRVSSSCFQVDPHDNHNAFISWLFS